MENELIEGSKSLAKAVIFFASDDSSAATAQNYIFDGGVVT